MDENSFITEADISETNDTRNRVGLYPLTLKHISAYQERINGFKLRNNHDVIFKSRSEILGSFPCDHFEWKILCFKSFEIN